MHSRLILIMLMGLITLTGCRPKNEYHGRTVHDIASEARQRGSLEAPVPYGFDEEEGTNLMVPTLDNALSQYEWMVGEPVEDKTIATGSRGIFTIYRFRVERRSDRHRHPEDQEAREIIDAMPPREGEMLVVKSGGNIVVDGVAKETR